MFRGNKAPEQTADMYVRERMLPFVHVAKNLVNRMVEDSEYVAVRPCWEERDGSPLPADQIRLELGGKWSQQDSVPQEFYVAMDTLEAVVSSIDRAHREESAVMQQEGTSPADYTPRHRLGDELWPTYPSIQAELSPNE